MGLVKLKISGKDKYSYLMNKSFIYFINSLNIEKFLISFALKIVCNSLNFQKPNIIQFKKKLLSKIKLGIFLRRGIKNLDFLLKKYQQIDKKINLNKFQYLEYNWFEKEFNLGKYNLIFNKIGLTHLYNSCC